jgi:hypothetical protein
MPPPNRTSLAKIPKTKALKTRGAPALLRPVSQQTAKSENAVTQILESLKAIQTLVTTATTGGEAAGWGMTCGAISMAIGVAIHSSFLVYFGPIGMTLGVGVFATRIFDRFRRFKRTEDRELNDRLEANDLLFAAGKLTEQEYNERRTRILNSYD